MIGVMDRRIISILLFVILVMASVPLVVKLTGGADQAPGGEPVQDFEFAEDRRLAITARQVQPLMRPRLGLYYTVAGAAAEAAEATEADAAEPAPPPTDPQGAEESEQAAAPAFFGTLPQEHQPPTFIAHTREDGRVVAVAAESDPGAVLILHDFETGESWPRHEIMEDERELEARGRLLVERLKAGRADDEPELRLVTAEGLRPLEQLIKLPSEPAQPQDERRQQPRR